MKTLHNSTASLKKKRGGGFLGQMNLQLVFWCVQSKLSFITFLREQSRREIWGQEEGRNECIILYSAGGGSPPASDNPPKAPLEVTTDLSPMFGTSRRSHTNPFTETKAGPVGNEAGVAGTERTDGANYQNKSLVLKERQLCGAGSPTPTRARRRGRLSELQLVGCTCHLKSSARIPRSQQAGST